MPWHATVDPSRRYVEIIYSGRVGPEDLQQALDRAIELGLTLPRPLFLADCSGMTTSPGLADLYFLADQLAALDHAASIREALILPALADSGDSVRFWETACANRGLSVRVFGAQPTALDWLLQVA
jgi:hypothetical protein